jgi:hypothetical protein
VALTDALPTAPGATYPMTIIEALWLASEGRLAPVMTPAGIETKIIDLPSNETAKAADAAVRDLVAASVLDPDRFFDLVNFLHSENLQRENAPGFARRVFDVISEGTIKLTRHLLDEFADMIAHPLREEEYQKFIARNPVLIDPLASDVISKQRLGIEYVTDFVIRRHDGEYVLVEIEKPTTPIFTSAVDFSNEFTHAFGQVLDFQAWVYHNGQYADHLLPGISQPRGVLVIGSPSEIDADRGRKLRAFCANSMRIEVFTFDQILKRATSLFESIHHKRD